MDIRILLIAVLTQLGMGMPVAGLALSYPPGTVFKYLYTTDTTLNEPDVPGITQAKKDVGFRLTAVCEVGCVWTDKHHHLMKMTISDPQLHSVARDDLARELKGLPRLPVYFHWVEGEVAEVFAFEDDSTLSVNIKKGIISLFQVQQESGLREEVDASGKCNIEYKREGNLIKKTKTLCSHSNVVGQFSNVNGLFDVSTRPTSHTTFEVNDDLIKGVVSLETFVSRVNIQDDIATSVAIRQDLHLDWTGSGPTVTASSLAEVVKRISSSEGHIFYSTSLETVFGEKRQCTGKCPSQTADIVRDLKEHLASSSMATKRASEAFLALVHAFRTSPKDTIKGILEDEENEDILPQLIDAAVAAQTHSAHQALVEYIKVEDELSEELSLRYLLSVALSSTHPDQLLLSDLLNLYEKELPLESVREAVGEALGAVTYTYCQRGSQCNEKIVEDVQSAILTRLEVCDEEGCKAQAIRALSNAGLHNTLPELLRYAEEATDPVISEAAIKALRKITVTDVEKLEIKNVMQRIFHQARRGYDTAVRSKALKILLESDPSEDELKMIVSETLDPWNTEYDMYIQARIFNLMAQDTKIKQMVKPVMRDTNISNYHILAPKGKSLAFSNPMAETLGAQADYFIYVENGKSGIMKRSGMDVNLFGGKQTLSVFSIGIFAAGMEGLLGEEVEEGQEEVVPTAGLALDLVDVSLPPITFFTGQGGLMSAIWNAPSEPVSALQVNILLHDHSERIHLQNGLIVEVDVQGCVSMDLTGSLSVSLWNKNSQSLIKNSASLLIKGSCRIVTPSFRTGVEFSADSEGSIDFQSDVDFYDKIKMCLQMGRPDLIYIHSVTKYEHAIGFNTGYISRIKRSRKLAAVSYPLPKPNADQCRAINDES